MIDDTDTIERETRSATTTPSISGGITLCISVVWSALVYTLKVAKMKEGSESDRGLRV